MRVRGALTAVRRASPKMLGSSSPAPCAPPAADAAPLALAPPGFDRSVRTGYIADGPQLSAHVRAAVEASAGRAIATSSPHQ